MIQEKRFIGAIDQGTTGTRFILFDRKGSPQASAYQEHAQIFPQPGWVEHDPVEIWNNTLAVMEKALKEAGATLGDLAALGITNQRETTVLWDKSTGCPVCNAIVWQDRRTARRCLKLREQGLSEQITVKTGLPVDPYFSATKIEWILDETPGLRERADRGEILFGTVDTWLVWNLTGQHLTDPTNASRTLLMDLSTLAWDEDLLEIFRIPPAILPAISPSSGDFGAIALEDSKVRVAGVLGDQQAALFGQAGFHSGSIKNTYGTGSFLLRNTGDILVRSKNGLLSTVAYVLEGQPTQYALEGSIFITGAALQWLRDGLGLIESAAETEAMARSVENTAGVVFVPAFAGLGAPYWNANARGTIFGLTRGTTKAHLVRAALEAMAFQSRDVMEAMALDASMQSQRNEHLKVDGGAVHNNFLCQFQSDILGLPVLRPIVVETTALGAAYAAGLAVGFWENTAKLESLWQVDHFFEPTISADKREQLYAEWKHAVRSVLAWTQEA